MFLRTSTGDWLKFLGRFCWKAFAGRPLPKCFFFESLTSILSAAFPDFSATNKNLCTFLAAGTITVRKNGALILPIPCESVRNLLSCCQPIDTSVEWNLYLSRSNHLVDVFSLEINNFGFPNCQSKSTDGEVYERYFCNARVSHVNFNTRKKLFEQGSDL